MKKAIWLLSSLSILLSCSGIQQNPSFIVKLQQPWLIQSADSVNADGSLISSHLFHATNWYPARVPTTVLHALVENGRFKNIYAGLNLKKIPKDIFHKSWWYRTQFDLDRLDELPFTVLKFKGINYRANIWLNGRQIASKDTLLGAFRVFSFDVSSIVKAKNNILAVQVFPPRAGDFTIGFVDWNPQPPDNNMGIWRDVELLRSRSVQIGRLFVKTKLNPDFDRAEITISVQLKNLSSDPVSGVLKGKIDTIHFRREVGLLGGEQREVTLSVDEFPQLSIENPHLWWPYTMGQAYLYSLNLTYEVNGSIISKKKIPFGIRQVKDYLNSDGYRGFMINGKKILIRGAGWTDDLMLSDSPQRMRDQLQYVKNMSLNTIRMEGFWGKDETIYNICDSLGIFIMVGWSCHWEWDSYVGKKCDRFGGVATMQEMDLISRSWQDQISMYRNHPSVLAWFEGSDKLPRPQLEKKYQALRARLDPTRPYLASAANRTSEVSGPTAVKMNGPYDYVPPIYWYQDSTHGGAYGFNTETGPGPQVPPLSSVKKMIPARHLWPIDSVWDYHCGRNEFNNLNRYLTALDKRYGKAKDLKDFIWKAQLLNYETIRPMFEAFAVHKFKSTGVIQWMLNSAWPEMYWQLYDYYLMPNGAFYGTKKACAPLQLIYNYQDRNIYCNNETLQSYDHLTARIRILDLQSKIILDKKITVSIAGNTVKKLYTLRKSILPDSVFFLDLQLLDDQNGRKAKNFYWLTKKGDVLDYPASTWFVTPVKRYADFTALQNMPEASILTEKQFRRQGALWKFKVRVTNPSSYMAFFLDVQVEDDQGEPILPVFLSDNYFTVLPADSQTIRGEVRTGPKPRLILTGRNLKKRVIID